MQQQGEATKGFFLIYGKYEHQGLAVFMKYLSKELPINNLCKKSKCVMLLE